MATATTRTRSTARPKTTPEGVVVAIVAVTGVEDEVNDVIVPGIFAAALAKRRPKVVFHHKFDDFAGRVLHAEEWMPGDRRLPKRTPAGAPWPAAAGALVVTMQFNMDTERGREVYEWARFFAESGEAAWSIGYRVPDGMGVKKGRVRWIYGIDVFEVSLVLHGANALTSALEVKSAPRGPSAGAVVAELAGPMEYKETPAGLPVTGPNVAGLVVKAADTGRVLLLQRALDDQDPASGKWEYPGGHLEKGEDPLAGAVREWQEEVGCDLPTGQVVEMWDSTNGKYRAHVYLVASEKQVNINRAHAERGTVNPDDPKGKNLEVVAWFDTPALPSNPAVREEVRTQTPWDLLALAGRGPRSSVMADLEAKGDTSPVGSPGDRENWVDQVGGLPTYVREIAHALIRAGHDESGAIRLAVGAVKRWAAGGDDVNADTRAKAAAAVADWEAKKAAAHADNVIESKTAAQVVTELAPATKDMETKMHPTRNGQPAFEETLDKVRSAVRAKYGDDAPKSEKGDAPCSWVTVDATFPDSVVFTILSDDGAKVGTYTAPWSATPDGTVTVGDKAPARVAVVSDASVPAAITPPTPTVVDRAALYTAEELRELARAAAAAPLEVKHLDALRGPVCDLLDTLALKGMDVAGMVLGEDEDDETKDADAAPDGDAGWSAFDDPDPDGEPDGDPDDEEEPLPEPGDEDDDEPAVDTPPGAAEERVYLDPDQVRADLDSIRP